MSPVKKDGKKKVARKKSKERPKAKEDPAESVSKSLKVRPVSLIHRFRSWLFYGRSGTGKTTVAGSFPTPMLFLDIKDQGTDSICDVEGIDVLEVETWDDFEVAYWWLIKNPGKYKSLVIDTITQLQQVGLERILEDNDKDADRAGEWGVMTKREWGQVASLMKMWITRLRDLPMEVVFLAQDRLSETETSDPEIQLDPEMGPRLSPSIAAHINAEVSVVGNTFIRRKTTVKKIGKKKKEVSKTQYCLRIGPNPVYVTKARKPKGIKLPSVLINPSYEELIATLQGE